MRLLGLFQFSLEHLSRTLGCLGQALPFLRALLSLAQSLTHGGYGSFAVRKLRFQVLEAFLNGDILVLQGLAVIAIMAKLLLLFAISVLQQIEHEIDLLCRRIEGVPVALLRDQGIILRLQGSKRFRSNILLFVRDNKLAIPGSGLLIQLIK